MRYIFMAILFLFMINAWGQAELLSVQDEDNEPPQASLSEVKIVLGETVQKELMQIYQQMAQLTQARERLVKILYEQEKARSGIDLGKDWQWAPGDSQLNTIIIKAKKKE